MSKPLRVLIVEDSEDDSLLLLRELSNGEYDPVWERVDTADAMSVALEEGSWDLVLSDFDMPRFNALAALNLVQQAGLDLPFIVVSGVIGEVEAVRIMKAGAHDYVFKNNLARLLPAIERELNEAEVRRQRKRAEEALRQSEADLRRSSEKLRALTARLITAQEEQSKHISRELHDDFNQKVAALVIGIGIIEKQPPESAKTFVKQLTKLRRLAETLADDVHHVSHSLHPAVLDYLGLVVALKSYCAEFTQKTGIKTKFTHRNIRRTLSKDVALCLYRVVQESLQNVRKHSARISILDLGLLDSTFLLS